MKLIGGVFTLDILISVSLYKRYIFADYLKIYTSFLRLTRLRRHEIE